MTKLLNLTIKIDNKDKYKNDSGNGVFNFINPPRVIEPTNLLIKDQGGTIVTQLKIKSNSGFFAWENKGTNTEIEFTLKNLKYNEKEGFSFGGTAGAADTLFLNANDFEVEVYKDKKEKEYKYSSSIAGDEEAITSFVSEIESYQNATPGSLKQKLYQLKNINDDFEKVKDICEKYLKEIQDLNQWKTVGIKTPNEVNIAQENGFDIIANSSLKNEIKEGKYKGFSIASPEKYKVVETNSFSFNSSLNVVDRNRYTKDNIDMFRDFFTNDLSQSDPKYFRGFRPGDIKQLSDGKFVSVNHQADVQNKKDNQ
ncbi:2007_t:CDS:2 [Ambispora gerdemannii]|uniref:2007_t:CDS:1 n=1 Tax=Ambispora gerdemannii TaxID=144530 RepID=A0A9N8YU25_9GLOM|nr:2007_t:CDS:2 [Ambispora gerdemannii]